MTGGCQGNEPGCASPGEVKPAGDTKNLLRVPDGSHAETSARPVCPNCGYAALPPLQFMIVQQRRWVSW